MPVEIPGPEYNKQVSLYNPFVEFPSLFRPGAQMVHVSGGGPNVFGHTLLCFDIANGNYAHIHKPGWSYPDVIAGHDDFKTYLKENGKEVWKEDYYEIEFPEKAREKLIHRLINTYFWGMAKHNCAQWAADVINAGRSAANRVDDGVLGMNLPILIKSQQTRSSPWGGHDYHKLND